MKRFNRKAKLYLILMLICFLAVPVVYTFAPDLAAAMAKPSTTAARAASIEEWRVFIIRILGVFILLFGLISGVKAFESNRRGSK